MSEPSDRLRVDKWLWHARFFKTRSMAAREVSDGKVRVNGVRIAKPAHLVGAGDVLTFVQARKVRVIRIEALGTRRGPAPEAQTLYADLEPVRDSGPENPGFEGKGRPTGRQRRRLDLSRRQALE
jgi:ribosome-associated heat shock protein Hsp15